MRCPRCNTIMKKTMHFENERQYAYNACPKCHMQTHPKRLHLEEYNQDEKNSTQENIKTTKQTDKSSKTYKPKFNPPVKQSKNKTNTSGKAQVKHNRQKH